MHKGQNGYGIYFSQKDDKMVVTKLDVKSEAEKAGVQPGDRLIKVRDLDGKLPAEDPGAAIEVTKENYSVRPACHRSGRGSRRHSIPASLLLRRAPLAGGARPGEEDEALRVPDC